MKSAPRPNVAASMAIAQPGADADDEHAAQRRAERRAVLFRTSRRSALACWIMSGGTVCGTIPAEAGKKKAETKPFSAAIVRSMPELGVAR